MKNNKNKSESRENPTFSFKLNNEIFDIYDQNKKYLHGYNIGLLVDGDDCDHFGVNQNQGKHIVCCIEHLRDNLKNDNRKHYGFLIDFDKQHEYQNHPILERLKEVITR